jgi:hypothetical protein
VPEGKSAADKPVPAWRYASGLTLFVLGHIVLFAAPIAVPALGFSSAYIAVVIVLAEVITTSSVFFLGWDGIKDLKNKLFRLFKYDASAPPVGRTRHNVGLFLVFFLSLALEVLGVVLVFIAFARTTREDPFPLVLGLDFEQLGWTVATLFIGSYIALIAGLVLLGDHWWGRFRELFVWQGSEA